ncbi:MAG TPA: hypothetical protein VF553_14370 [Pyrinomonadaceae bacterium]
MAEVKVNVKKFRWTTFALILLCFFLPFVQVSCREQKLMSITGFQLAFGMELEEPQMFGPTRTRKVPGEALVLLTLLATLAGLGCSFLKGKLGFLLPAICGACGLLFMLIVKVRLDNDVLRQGGGLLTLEYLFGFIVTCLLLLVSAGVNGFFFQSERKSAAGG